LGSLKSLVETGEGLPRFEGPQPPADLDGGDEHRRLAMEANDAAWELLGRDDPPSGDAADDLLGRAYAAAHHWRRAEGAGPERAARASWLLARCHAVLGQGDLALHHADRAAAVVHEARLGDFDLAYAHEGRARALACLGRLVDAAAELAAARAVPIADDEDRKIFEADCDAGPWFDLTGTDEPQ
jgi:hypothetical protein